MFKKLWRAGFVLMLFLTGCLSRHDECMRKTQQKYPNKTRQELLSHCVHLEGK